MDLLNAALGLQNEADNKKKRARLAKQKKKKPKRSKAKSDKDSSSAYHFIAFVPVGQRVWQLDGLTSTPVCIGKHLFSGHLTTAPLTLHQANTKKASTGPPSCAPSSRRE